MAHLIQIGNSLGIRIPKNVIQEAGLADVELSLKVVAEGLLITPQNKPRHGWAEKINAIQKGQTEEVFLQEISNKFDEDEWQW